MLVRIFIGVVIVVSLCFSSAIATKPSIPSLKMEMSIIHDGNWEVGKENRVTFKFKPLEEVPHKTKHPDEAVVTFDSGLVSMSGEVGWSGILEKNKEYAITVVLKPTKPGKFGVWGVVASCLLKIYSDEELRKMEEQFYKQIEQSPELKKRGERPKYPKKSFLFRNGTSAIIEVIGPPQNQSDTTWIESNGMKAGQIEIIRPLDSLLKRPFELKKRETPPLEEPGNDSSRDSS